MRDEGRYGVDGKYRERSDTTAPCSDQLGSGPEKRGSGYLEPKKEKEKKRETTRIARKRRQIPRGNFNKVL